MEQLTEFVAKSFAEGKPPVVLDNEKDPNKATQMQAAHMISNLFSTMPPMPTTTPWSLYPFPLFSSQTEMNSPFHSKLSLNSMMERFGEIQSHLSRPHSHLHYPTSMMYTPKSPIFPLLLPNSSTLFHVRNEEKDYEDPCKNDPDKNISFDKESNVSGKSLIEYLTTKSL